MLYPVTPMKWILCCLGLGWGRQPLMGGGGGGGATSLSWLYGPNFCKLFTFYPIISLVLPCNFYTMGLDTLGSRVRGIHQYHYFCDRSREGSLNVSQREWAGNDGEGDVGMRLTLPAAESRQCLSATCLSICCKYLRPPCISSHCRRHSLLWWLSLFPATFLGAMKPFYRRIL